MSPRYICCCTWSWEGWWGRCWCTPPPAPPGSGPPPGSATHHSPTYNNQNRPIYKTKIVSVTHLGSLWEMPDLNPGVWVIEPIFHPSLQHNLCECAFGQIFYLTRASFLRDFNPLVTRATFVDRFSTNLQSRLKKVKMEFHFKKKNLNIHILRYLAFKKKFWFCFSNAISLFFNEFVCNFNSL